MEGVTDKDFEMRIEELENQLKELITARMKLRDISEDELRTYYKVKEYLRADWGDFCGINDCFVCHVCKVCTVCRVCSVCSVCFECSCGPCNLGHLEEAASSRFKSLGKK